MARRFWAFTLAETLIVMGIIGVVAALTVPNLNSSTGEKEKVAKVKKIYKDLDDALGRAIAVYGPLDEWFTKDTTTEAKSTRFAERLLDFMKVSKNCQLNVSAGCFPTTKFKNFDGSEDTKTRISPGTYSFITADGTSVGIYLNFSRNVAFTLIYIDIDGPQKGPNRAEYDAFLLHVCNDHITSIGECSEEDTSGKFDDWYHPVVWIMQNDNMDYLKIDSNGKCPNGTVLSWTNTTCK